MAVAPGRLYHMAELPKAQARKKKEKRRRKLLTAKVYHLLIRTGHKLNVHDLPDAGRVSGPLNVALAAFVEDRST